MYKTLRQILAVGFLGIAFTPLFSMAKVTDVELSEVVLQDKFEEIYAVGILHPYQEVIVRPEASGRIVNIAFKEGESVEEGDLLLALDSSIEAAELRETTARRVLAKQNLDRLLAAKGGSTAQARDIAQAEYEQAVANEAIAKAKYDRRFIYAPFSGTVGLKNVELGDYVQAGADIVRLLNIDQLRLEFNIPERVAHVVETGQNVKFTIDNFPNKLFAAEVYAVSPEIEQKGRSLTVLARFHNEDQSLIAGSFARLNLLVPLNYQVIIIPEESIFASEGAQFVYRAKPTSDPDVFEAELVPVEIGQRSTFNVEILSGLNADDIVVKAGQVRIKDESLVRDVTGDIKLRIPTSQGGASQVLGSDQSVGEAE
ncbi:efflux RND transporter periplasmic adaptor subunit [Ignatzschineria rhizosphaerae]|uniref:Efflux RND transporter periplasmic adaptor subunit n=1 Tax=Ignatzschineria rhizosphaerae TaxID=2923279 RepID=A0ABY3WWI2_9GAMM|nr:efflux RND transporter periplasmic adaptor subunit [Ignatzschineria rhizosphaerae]UNM94976.1 efflux RND transporter periplasmic adaptor subunit [Ignatzschineria rhizosphaerae]